MEPSSLGHRGNLLTCVAVAAGWLGCGGLEDGEREISSEATACTVVAAGSPWWSTSFPQQDGRFHVELTATPSADNLDAVVGLSRGAASQWGKLAATVRFNPAGFIDVRAGDAYRADAAYAYHAGVTYGIRLDVDVRTRTYSVWLRSSAFERYAPIARDYAFRTEQAAVTALDTAAGYAEPSRPGSLTICELQVVRDDTTADGCMSSAAGGGFANAWIAQTTGAMLARFTARPSQASMDAVVGFAGGAVDAYGDLAASIRFWTNGMIEARDGGAYRADRAVPYTAGATYDFEVVVDLPTKTYSVLVARVASSREYVELARGYRFRTEQQAAAALDHAAAAVDSAGRIDVCEIANTSPRSLALARPGSYFTLPLPGGGALISDEARTQRLSAAGATVAVVPRGGMSAVDGSGNIYIASAAGGTLTLSAFTSALAPRWSRTYAAAGGVIAMGAYATGELAIAVGAWRPEQLIQIGANGAERLRRDLAQYPAMAIGIGRDSYVIAYRLGGGVVVEAHRPDGSLLWQRSWSGDFTVDHLARDPSGGAILAGTFNGTVDFGDGPLEPAANPDSSLNTFIVSLSSAGALRFSRHIFTSYPTGVASSGDRIALATVYWTQMPYMELRAFDAAGAQVWALGGGFRSEELGFTGTVAVGGGGRIYANLSPKFYPGALAPPWPFLFAFDP